MASPLKSNNNTAHPRSDNTGIQHNANVHSPGTWQYQLTESMLMHNAGGQDIGTTSIHSKQEALRRSEEKNENDKEQREDHVEFIPPTDEPQDINDITTPQRFGHYIDRRFAPVSDDDRSHKAIHPFEDYEEQEEPKAARIPHGSILFLLGFICPPSWWIGTFYPFTCFQAEPATIPKLERRWRSANRVMTLISILLIAVLLGIMGWYINKYKSGST
jgi:hypothetical protein